MTDSFYIIVFSLLLGISKSYNFTMHTLEYIGLYTKINDLDQYNKTKSWENCFDCHKVYYVLNVGISGFFIQL